ncbi:MAG: hypothetical protein KatS3mg128_0436 [Silanimonas sp.]|nr:MAG: hypothetical protein KatS3mg128_0436 [Silanimonas sp.]
MEHHASALHIAPMGRAAIDDLAKVSALNPGFQLEAV